MNIDFSIDIHESPEKVFPWIAEPEKAMKWQKNVKGGKILKQGSGMAGTTFIEEIEENGKSLTMKGKITGFIKDKEIEFHLESKIHTVDIRYRVDPIETGTRVSIKSDIIWKFPVNILSIFMGKKIKLGIIQQLEKELIDLKNLCEK